MNEKLSLFVLSLIITLGFLSIVFSSPEVKTVDHSKECEHYVNAGVKKLPEYCITYFSSKKMEY